MITISIVCLQLHIVSGCFEEQEETLRQKIIKSQRSEPLRWFLFQLFKLCSQQFSLLQRCWKAGLSDQEVGHRSATIYQDRMEVGQDCFCGYYSVCAVLVTLCMCHAHRLGWVNMQRHNRTLMYQDKSCRFSGNPKGISRKMMKMCISALFQIWKHPGSLFQNCPRYHRQGVSHLQPLHLCNHSFQIQVRAAHHLTSGQEMRCVICRKIVIFNRDTLAEKVPCLHFLSQATRRERMSVSQSESSLRDSMLSRHASGCKTMFHRVMSMSTTDTVSLGSLCSDVNIGQRCSLLLSEIILGLFCLLRSCRTSWIPPEVRWWGWCLLMCLAARLERRGAGPCQPFSAVQLLTERSEGQRIQLTGDATGGEGKLKPGTGTLDI